ncbi:MATE family efflux pump [Pontimonas salivibrio]|uniref:MATE family efflux pump n=1 Tax=Pontimonas salivibrio TaxID=1159327 RepID=A0A2L2BNH3_9MICO|nr:MATE family efflux transporter [Pontimonas salivibrio]AVG23211.1 MATE family efflux pump [Pontimonas salivibrio]
MRTTPLDRRIFTLAWPALGALIAEPLFLLTDTAMVGHLGGEALASLGLAGIILQTLVGLLIFLAYATTPFVARRLGAGDERGALAAGVDGVWLAIFLGVTVGTLGIFLGSTLVSWFGAEVTVSEGATDYLTISWWGLPGMLIVLAATGVLRGLQDTRTPLVVALVGFSLNALLNAVLIYGLDLGLVGSAWGTVLAQWMMALWLSGVVISRARSVGAGLRPGSAGIARAAQLGGWLFIRTISLRVAFVGATLVATQLGTDQLAAWHVAFTVFTLIALALDSLAIASQALVGHQLGAGDPVSTRQVVSRTVWWGLWGGAGLGVVLATSAPVLPLIVTSDTAVRALLIPTLLTLALAMPLGGYVFVLDGVLMGAGDGRYLALTGVLNVLVVIPLFFMTLYVSETVGPTWVGLALLQASVGLGYLGARALTLGLRVRGDRWMVIGAHS